MGKRRERRTARRPPLRRRSDAGCTGGDEFVKRELADGGTAWRPGPGRQTVTSIWGSSADDVWMTAED